MERSLVLTGSLVRLETLRAEHAEGLATAASDDPFEFLSVPRSVMEAVRYVKKARAGRRAGSSIGFAIIDRRSERIVGSTRFKNLMYRDETSTGCAPCAAEIGNTWMASESWGSGLNLETKQLMLAHAFDGMGVRRVSFKVDIRNDRARAAVIKLGVTCEGELRAHSYGRDGALRSVISYSVLAEEWPAVRDIISLSLFHPAPEGL
jgi:RimJ/RimL family protein N-acetyltransferase